MVFREWCYISGNRYHSSVFNEAWNKLLEFYCLYSRLQGSILWTTNYTQIIHNLYCALLQPLDLFKICHKNVRAQRHLMLYNSSPFCWLQKKNFFSLVNEGVPSDSSGGLMALCIITWIAEEMRLLLSCKKMFCWQGIQIWQTDSLRKHIILLQFL